MQKTHWIFIGGLLLLAGLLWYQNQRHEQTLLELRQEIAAARRSNPSTPNGRPAIDPYQAKQVKNTLTKQSKQLQACYLAYLATHPPRTKGEVKVDWQISAEGHVIQAGIIWNAFQNQDFGNCLVSEIRKITFPPPPQAPFYVEHSLNFQTEAELQKELKEPPKLRFNPQP